MYSGGMAERARIIKTSLTNMFPLIEKQNVLIVLLNQVMAEIGGWRPGVTSAGGNALKHDAHIRLEVSGGKTEYDGVYATEKQSKVNVEKSKISPVMNGIRMKIDITKGGVIDRPGSLVWWMTELEKPSVFKSGAWWSIEDWCYEKYKVYWDRIGGLYPKFRQAELYNKASEPDSPLVDLLRLIWVDLISERYVLQAEICKPVKISLEASLALKLGVTEEDLKAMNETNNEESEMTEEIVSGLVDVLGLTVDTETGEVK